MRDNQTEYLAIVSNISEMYNGELSEVEVHTATRNFIEFVKMLVKYYEKDN